jgi:hypothetical protein
VSYTNPVPGGNVGRTDQGVDISAAPGTPVRAITDETLVGVIPNWFNGQPFYWFKEKVGGAYNYVAEQVRSNLRIGQSVRAGDQIGTVAPSGTGLELGWATAGGQTLARSTTGYREGQATPAGQDYRQRVIQGGGAPQTTTLAQLWIDAGGTPALANTMAAIAMAESGGNESTPPSKNSDGSTDFGLWRINSSHTQFDQQRLQSDPLYNAQAAVSVFKSQGLTAWTTYTSGAYRQFLAGAARDPVKGYGGTRPGGEPAQPDPGATSEQYLQEYVSLRDTPRTAPPNTKNPFQWWSASFLDNWNQIGQ